jgi:hypothetical protein
MPKDQDGPEPDIIEIVDENLKAGFAQLPRPVLRAKGLTFRAKLLYVALLDYAWQKGSCFPGHATLAQDLDTSHDTVRRGLAELREYGLVTWKQQGLNKPNVYYLLRLSNCPRLWAPEAEDAELRHPEDANWRLQGNAELRHKEYSSNNTHKSIRKSKSEEIDSKPDQTLSYKIRLDQKPARKRQEGSGGSTKPHSIRVGELLAHRQHQTAKTASREQADFLAYIRGVIGRYAEELKDQAQTAWSINSILRLLRSSKIPQGSWDYELQQAFNQTAGGDVGNAIAGDTYHTNRFPYFRSVLADRLGLKGADGH